MASLFGADKNQALTLLEGYGKPQSERPSRRLPRSSARTAGFDCAFYQVPDYTHGHGKVVSTT